MENSFGQKSLEIFLDETVWQIKEKRSVIRKNEIHFNTKEMNWKDIEKIGLKVPAGKSALLVSQW